MDKMVKNKRILVGLLALTALAGCSSPEKRSQANRGFDYQQESLRIRPLLIPAGLDAPAFNNEFVVPALSAQAALGAKGTELDIRPPIQILPLIRGSQVADQGSALWFYQQRLDQPLEQELAQALESFLKKQKIDFNSNDQGWLTDWVGAKGEPELRYVWQFAPDPVRRAVALSVTIVEQRGASTLRPQDRQRAEAVMLNAFSLDYQSALTARENELDKGPIGIELDSAQGRVLAAEGYDRTWRRLVTLLPKMGFAITNRQQALGYVDVEFDGLSDGKWQKLGLPALDIPEDEYRIQLGDLGNQTSIMINDKERVPVSAEVLDHFGRTLAKAFERTELIR